MKIVEAFCYVVITGSSYLLAATFFNLNERVMQMWMAIHVGTLVGLTVVAAKFAWTEAVSFYRHVKGVQDD